MTKPREQPDYLVLGSGLAALSFAALAAKAGKRVQVLEAHYHHGGYGHTFEEAGKYRFNAQLHYVWNCGPDQTVGRFLRKLGLEQEVTFEQYDSGGYDHMRMPGYALDIPYDRELLIERLRDLFPSHARNCEAFVREVWQVADEMESLPSPVRLLPVLLRLPSFSRVIRYRNATLQQVFDRFGLPLEAQTLLALQWPDFLLPPDQLSFFMWVALFTGYCRGAYYPTKHFEHVVDSIVDVIEQYGGEVLTNHKVTKFLLEEGTIQGVRVEKVLDNGAGTGEFSEFRSPRIICNIDPKSVAQQIGLSHFSAAVRRKLAYDYSASNFVAYLAVEGIDLRDFGFGRWNIFHSEQPDLNRCFADMYERGDYSAPSFGVATPGLLTDVGGDCPEGQQIMELLTVADYHRFHDLKIADEKAYRAKKLEILNSILDILERDYVPNLREHIVFKMTGAPTTSERYCRAPAGNSYGSKMTPDNVGGNRLDHHSSIPGLSFCNASAGYPSFAGAIGTGGNLYEQLTGDRFLK